MRKANKIIIFSLGGVLAIMLVLSGIVIATGGNLLDVLGWRSEVKIENEKVKEAFVEDRYKLQVSEGVLEMDKGTVVENYYISLPKALKDLEDGLYFNYAPSMMDSDIYKDELQRYSEREGAYPLIVFNASNKKSGTLGYEIYSALSGKEFGYQTAILYLVKNGKIVEELNSSIKAGKLPVDN